MKPGVRDMTREGNSCGYVLTQLNKNGGVRKQLYVHTTTICNHGACTPTPRHSSDYDLTSARQPRDNSSDYELTSGRECIYSRDAQYVELSL